MVKECVMIAYERFLKLRETDSGDPVNKFVERTQPLEAKQPLDPAVEEIIPDEKKSQPQEQEQQELQEQEQAALTDEEKRQQTTDTTTKNVSKQNLNQGNGEDVKQAS